MRFTAVGALALAAMLAACDGAPATVLRLENATDIPLAVHVDDAWVGTYPAGETRDVPIRDGAPYRIDVRSESGAILSALEVSLEDASMIAADRRSIQATTDTPCGMIRLTVGSAAEAPMPPSTSTPGACP